MIDVLIIGGGNAALCAALTAREQLGRGARVLMLEAAPRAWRGGNSSHTRNLRCMHDAPQDVLTQAYPEEEFWQDLLKVTGGQTTQSMARFAIRDSATVRDWMRRHGVRFQPSLSGTLHLSRTNAFFMGGGKALVNAYYRSAESLGIEIRYEAKVAHLEMQPDGASAATDAGRTQFVAALLENGERIAAKSCVVACGGFESDRAWLRQAWGQNAAGEWPSDNFAIRGTRYNMGVVLKDLMNQGAAMVGDATQAHMVAIDARAPLYDGGICTRVDCVSLGIMVNAQAQRFYDEGEDFWPKRYAIWGRLVAQQPQQIAYSIIDAKAVGRFMPPVFKGVQADSLPELAQLLGLDVAALIRTVTGYNAACSVQRGEGTFDHSVLDDCMTTGLAVNKTHWALPLDTAPFYGYALKPGVTFTYLGLKVQEDCAVQFPSARSGLGLEAEANHSAIADDDNDGRFVKSPNLFAAGEIMAGNVLGKGYTAGVGMTIGTAFGRAAGRSAAAAVAKLTV
jgi:tricarballylate dehydrogenase